ncbi:hypothetical protein ACJIZ3_001941 [Penstemon smallii]|uniref:Glycoside hydrolase family 5 domain-containing protein n=1 Tax=Penstemon smallii TaxID=265156 RepID=A0ABD3U7J9_9LAMI
MQKLLVVYFLLILSFTTPPQYESLPLSTSSRWIIDESSSARVKLTCVNWAAHLEPMLPEGLDRKPLAQIAKHISSMGFNCVRLTWATYMFTRYANLTVAQSFERLGLSDSIEGISNNNPEFLNYSVVEAQRAVIEELGDEGVMVVLDNQVSQPMWCCSDNDGNGFFGDKYFDANEWLQGLDIVANRYKDTSMVVAMSMRNELRGPLQNESIWYEHIQRGATTIHNTNPNLLVIVSGLHYDLDFTFLKEKPLKLSTLKNKLVYETHRYSFSAGQTQLWLTQPFNKVCESITQDIHTKAGFLTEGENLAPLFVSEFGINQAEVNPAESLFLDCFLGYLAEMDLDWSVWALQGSYYLRDGLHGPEETYGMLDSNWSSIRNIEFHQKLQLIHHQMQDPNSNGSSYYILYHPSSGRCVNVENSEVHATDCWSFSRWKHEAGNRNPIRLMDSELCLSAGGDGTPVALSTDCTKEQSQWESLSNSKFQLANKDENGTYSCLEWDPNYSSIIQTNKCMCLEDSVNCTQRNPQTQWFKLVLANV